MKFGTVEYQESIDQDSFVEVIRSLKLAPPVIVKPNWGFSVVFTEATILDWVLSALEGEVLVVESYGWARCEEAVTKKEYGPFTKDALRHSDKWFLDYSGIGKVLEKYNVEYLNITEEVWGGRIADPKIIQQLVEEAFPPVHDEVLYSYIPEQLYQLHGGSLLSLAKLKFMEDDIVISLSIKNLFGMIPGPDRGPFHGKENRLMDPSIVDMNKIYRALFQVNGVVEAVFTASRGMTLDPTIYRDNGYLWASPDTLNLDAVVSAHVGIMPQVVGHLRKAAECFGGWDKAAVSKAGKKRIHSFD